MVTYFDSRVKAFVFLLMFVTFLLTFPYRVMAREGKQGEETHEVMARKGRQGEKTQIDPGTVISITVGLLDRVIKVLEEYSRAIVIARTQVSGPDGDDLDGPDEDYDADWGDAELDAKAESEAPNDQDDGETCSYRKGNPHKACISILYEDPRDGIFDNWKPKVFPKNNTDCGILNNKGEIEYPGKASGFRGFVKASKDDDPVKGETVTEAVAVGGYSATGKGKDFCFEAKTTEDNPGYVKVKSLSIEDCKKKDSAESRKKLNANDVIDPHIRWEEGIIFVTSVDKFSFEGVASNQVLIRPRIGPIIELYHFYLQRDGDLRIFPIVEGHDEVVQKIKMEIYEKQISDTEWKISYDSSELADLTVVGTALYLKEMVVTRENGESNYQLLKKYFSSEEAVKIIAPKQAQKGYEPEVSFRTSVSSGEDITEIFGLDFTVPFGGDPQGEQEKLIGITAKISGNIDTAVTIAANTEGHFVKDLIETNWDGQSQSVKFEIPGMGFHYEDSSDLVDKEVASPPPCLVNLSKFNVTNREGKVFVNWVTKSEIDNAGFRLWRAMKGQHNGYKPTLLREFDHSEQVNPELNKNCSTKIQGQLKSNNFNEPSKLISAGGNSAESTCYSFTDMSDLSNGTYYYLLEDIDNKGNSTFHCNYIDTVTVGQGPAIDLQSAINYCKEVTGSNN